MSKKISYNAVFLKPDSSEIILENFKGKDLRNYLESLLLQHYNIEYKFTPYGVYDLRLRRTRISKFVRNIIPHCEICDNPN